jgi:plasmid stabilization system protein ParE
MIIFHPSVRRDLNGILRYYADEGGENLADRFFDTFMAAATSAEAHPGRFHPAAGTVFRRAQIPGFPYHFLFRETPYGIRVSVVRHDKRHPDFGTRRI